MTIHLQRDGPVIGTNRDQKGWLYWECIREVRKHARHWPGGVRHGYHHASHHRACHSAGWRRRLVRPGPLVLSGETRSDRACFEFAEGRKATASAGHLRTGRFSDLRNRAGKGVQQGMRAAWAPGQFECGSGLLTGKQTVRSAYWDMSESSGYRPCKCGAVYDGSEHIVEAREISSFECTVCGATIENWNSAWVPRYRFIACPATDAE